MNNGEKIRLSAAGVARREAMLHDLKVAVVRRRRHRAATRWGGLTALAAVLVLALCWSAVRGTRTGAPARQEAVFKANAFSLQHPELSNVRLEVIRDEPGLLARSWVGDDELLALLAAAHHPAGLIRVEGRVILTGEEIVDF